MNDITILIKPASSLCNMRCDYCFYTELSKSREVCSYGIMEDSTLQMLVRRAFAFATHSVSFVFQGGEPTLAGLDFFKRAVEYQRKYNFGGIAVYNSIQTNGINIDEKWACFLKENGFLVGISLDGGELIHNKHRKLSSGEGSYGRVIAGIKVLEAHGVPFNILAVISADSAREPKSVYHALCEYGYLQFIPLIDSTDRYSPKSDEYGRFLTETFDLYYRDIMRGKYVSIRDFDSYINMLRGMPPSSCAMQGRCGGYFTVEADGSVYPCDFYVTDKYKMGNILKSSFFTLSKSEVAANFIESSSTLSEECKSCSWRPLCRGGCRRHREPFPSLFKFCKAYKYFFENSYGKMLKIVDMLNNVGKQR